MSRSMLRLLYDAQGGICAGCGGRMNPMTNMLMADPLASASIDHVVPTSLGGLDDYSNIVAMHILCNNRKGNRLPTGCEMIWSHAVSSILGAERHGLMQALGAPIRRATLADLWPQGA